MVVDVSERDAFERRLKRIAKAKPKGKRKNEPK
jgi:hypothetical protein